MTGQEVGQQGTAVPPPPGQQLLLQTKLPAGDQTKSFAVLTKGQAAAAADETATITKSALGQISLEDSRQV